MNLRERQSSRKYIVVPSSPLGAHSRTASRTGSSPLSTPPYGESRESTLRPGVRFRKTASSLRIIATKGNATLAAGLTYPKIHNPDLELYLKLKKREHEFAEAIVPAVAPFQYIPSPARDAELSAASARIYRPQLQQNANAQPIDQKFENYNGWFQDMKIKVHMRLVQSQQMKDNNNISLEEQLEPQPQSHQPTPMTRKLSKKELKQKKKGIYDAIDAPPSTSHSTPVPLISPKINKVDISGSDTKRTRKKSLLSMKDILPTSAREKNKKSAMAWEASRESWFAESTPHNGSNPSTPKGRLTRASSFGAHPTTPHIYIPSVPSDAPSSPLRPRARTQAPPVQKQVLPPSSSSSVSVSGSSSLASSPLSSLTASPINNTPPSNNSPTAATTYNMPFGSSTPTNPQLTQPVFLARGKKMHSEYDIRKLRFKARNSVGLDVIGE